MMAPSLMSGHTYVPMDEKERKKYMQLLTGSVNDMLRVSPGGYTLPKQYLDFQEKVYQFQFRPDDVLIMTYSKSGTTWMQEILWTMRNNPDLDNPMAEVPLLARAPFLESDMLFRDAHKDGATPEMMSGMMEKFNQVCPGKDPKDGVQIQMLEAQPANRTIKTHLPFSMLPQNLLYKCKIVYVIRNPKDTVVSWLHHHRIWKNHGYVGNQDEFVDYFVNDLLLYGSFANIIKEAWENRNHPNMHVVFYEDLKNDIEGELKRLNRFIGTNLNEKQLSNVKEYTSFASMKARDPMKIADSPFLNQDVVKTDGGFLRKGVAGSWKGKLTEKQVKKIDNYVAKNFEGTGISFKY